MVNGYSAARAIDRIDGGGGPHRGNDVGQVLDVLDLDIDQHVKEVDLPVDDFQVGDIAAVLGDQG